MGSGAATTPDDSQLVSGPAIKPRSQSGSSSTARSDATSPDSCPPDHRWRRKLYQLPSWLISMIFHLVLLILLALWTQETIKGDRIDVISVGGVDDSIGDLDDLGTAALQQASSDALTADPLADLATVERHLLTVDSSPERSSLSTENSLFPLNVDPRMLTAGSPATGGGLDGRDPGARGRQLGSPHGPTAETELAVQRGLRWLVAHQREDGSWRFDHSNQCNCANPGSEASTTAATAIALLPFLGAGYTHKRESEYQETVDKGIYYLGSRMLITPNGGDLQEGTMYAQGLATIALCEAYAMTGDDTLKPYARSALDFINYAQDKKGGGWRYTPGQQGDTTVFGWQLMALKSGTLARLDVSSSNFMLAERFLNSVQTNGGAGYGYQTPKREETTTAVGLLSRMYLGWNREHEALRSGVEYLDKLGPSADNMYYNYYATQVMHHYGGPHWYRWNDRMRPILLSTQAQRGHEAGSWYFSGGHAETGGRLYNTAMCVMTLEVYYRYMPLYDAPAVGGEL